MAQMRLWLDQANSQPSSFRWIGADTIQVIFPQDQQALRFAREFRGNLRGIGCDRAFVATRPPGAAKTQCIT